VSVFARNISWQDIVFKKIGTGKKKKGLGGESANGRFGMKKMIGQARKHPPEGKKPKIYGTRTKAV